MRNETKTTQQKLDELIAAVDNLFDSQTITNQSGKWSEFNEATETLKDAANEAKKNDSVQVVTMSGKLIEAELIRTSEFDSLVLVGESHWTTNDVGTDGKIRTLDIELAGYSLDDAVAVFERRLEAKKTTCEFCDNDATGKTQADEAICENCCEKFAVDAVDENAKKKSFRYTLSNETTVDFFGTYEERLLFEENFENSALFIVSGEDLAKVEKPYPCPEAVVGARYITDLGFVVIVENVDERFGTIRFTGGGLIASSRFPKLYKRIASIDTRVVCSNSMSSKPMSMQERLERFGDRD